MYVCIYIYIYICVCVCVCVCIYMYVNQGFIQALRVSACLLKKALWPLFMDGV